MKEIRRKYEEICGKYENKDSPYIWAVGLGKISSSSSYFGEGGWFAISRFRGTPEKRHETCQNFAARVSPDFLILTYKLLFFKFN